MSGDWNTKYGTRRVRRDPPTLEEAIFAAAGMTDDVREQAEIAASLMGVPVKTVQAELAKPAYRMSRPKRLIEFTRGNQRAVVVEHRSPRRRPARP